LETQKSELNSLRFNDDNILRSYLLGTLPQERAEQLEESLLKDDETIEHLSLIEDELIEDYARNALEAGDRQQFERYFLSNPKRRRKLMLVRGLRKYTEDVGHVSAADRIPARPWYIPHPSPQWAAIAAVLVVAVGALLLWPIYFGRNDVDKGLVALNEAYKTKRPVEARVTGLDYAPYSPTRGPNDVNSRELDRSAALLQNAVNEKNSPEAIHALGRFYLFKRDFDKAVGEFEEALKARPNDANIQSDLGAALFEKGKIERSTDQSGRGETTLARSLEHLNRALELNDSLLDARFNRALLYEEMRLTPQALDDWNKYLTYDSSSRWAEEARRKIEELKKRSEKVSQRNNDLLAQFSEARAAGDREKMWQVFSKAHMNTGNSITNTLIDNYLVAVAAPATSQAAAESLETLTDLGRLANDKTGDPFTADIAQVYRSLTATQQKSLAQARKDAATGYGFFNQAKYDLAISLYDRAKSVFATVGDHPEALLASFWLSFCYLQQPNTQTSLSIGEQADRECEARNYKWLRSLMQIGLVNGRMRKTEYSQAMKLGSASYATSQQIADQNGEIRSLSIIADLYRILGNYRRALYTAQEGRDLGIEIFAGPSQMAGFYAVSARSLMLLGHYPAALEYQKQAVSLGEAMNTPAARSRYRVQMGMIQGKLKNYDEAIRNIRLGIEASQSAGEERTRKEMNTYGQVYLGRVFRESGHLNEALVALGEAENFCQGNDEQLWLLHEIKKEQLLTRIANGDVVAAKEELARVLNDYEDQRQKILEESNRSTFFDKEQSIYDVAIDFARTHSPDPKEAFDYSERSRGRSLLDTSTKGWHVTDKEGVPEPRYVGTVKPVTLDQLQKQLPEHAQLLQFAVLNDKLIAWYLTRDRFETVAVNVTSDELSTRVDRLLNLVASPTNDNDKQLQGVSGELYDLLIAPLAQYLDSGKQLVVVPDKILNLLPFNVLFSSSSHRYLVEDFVLSYAASANVFVRDTALANEKHAATITDDEKFLGVGNPSFDRTAFPDLDDLPSATREVEAIAEFYHPEVLLRGDEAKKASVLSAMRSADVLHLATHYLPDSNSPMLGRLVLVSEPHANDQAPSANGVLQAYEIYRLKPLHARLAVLAGCKTGVEDYVNGEGPIGLARPFNAAGVPLVVASLWPVDSRATTELMIEFHRLRRQKHYSSAEALRGAQTQMLRQGNPDHRSPYYWASFSLTGGYSDY
jgi:CHAT domain-containing protein/Tfp pilus assembly protein PilF